MIRVQNVEKRFKKVTALDGVDVEAADGQITTLLGANGSGKSTMMRIIAGLLQPDAGAAFIDDIEVGKDPLGARARLGLFPDQFGLYPRLTAREHLEYFARFHGVKGKALKTAVARVAEEINLGDILNRRTEGFSQGQRMKVALGRTLIHEPPNLILDEPTRGLDIMNIRLLRDTLKRMRDDGRCILLSSHVMAEVSELSDRVVIIDKGRIVADGAPAAIIEETGARDLEDAFMRAIGHRSAA